MGKKVTRRDFLKGAAIVGVGGAAAGLAGCTTGGTAVTEGPVASADDIIWDEEHDIIVIGSGYAGLCAAIEAKNGGAEVVVLEKGPVPGGNSIMCGGYIQAGGGTSVQKAAGIEDTPERFYNDIYKYGHFRAEPILVKTYVDNSPGLIDWLSDLGLLWDPILAKMEGMSVDCTHRPAVSSDYPGASGISSWTVINNECTRLGIPTVLNVTCNKLIQRDDKTILGVEADLGGKTVRYKAKKAVILGTGGYKANIPMRNNWDPRIDEDVSAGGLPYVESLGEMSEAAVDCGAAQRDMSFVCEFRFKWGTAVYQYWEPTDIQTVPDYSTGFPIGDYNNVMIVKNDGKRFVDEHAAGEYPQTPFYEAFLNILEHPRRVWIIADAGTAELNKWDVDPLVNPDPTVHPNTSPDRVAVAETLDELATKIGVDAAALKAEVERYNSFCDAGSDADFGKKGIAHKIETGPFYALKLIFFAHDQQSGLTVNTKSQVISRTAYFGALKALDDRDIIPHLYACGEVCGGYFGEERGHSKIGVHMFWGRNAGTAAAKEPEIA